MCGCGGVFGVCLCEVGFVDWDGYCVCGSVDECGVVEVGEKVCEMMLWYCLGGVGAGTGIGVGVIIFMIRWM